MNDSSETLLGPGKERSVVDQPAQQSGANGASSAHSFRNFEGLVHIPLVEIHGDFLEESRSTRIVSMACGITQTMEERITMAPGAVKRWQELWYPLAGTRGLTEANREIALSLHTDDGKLVLGIQSTRARPGAHTVVTRGGATLFEKREDLSPAITVVDIFEFSGDAKDVDVQVTDSDGGVLIEKTFAVDAIRPAFVKRGP